MSLTFNLRLLATVQISTALTSKLYQLNHNLSKVSLQSALVEDEMHAVRGVVNCASICHHKDNNGFPCNGFVLEKERQFLRHWEESFLLLYQLSIALYWQ